MPKKTKTAKEVIDKVDKKSIQDPKVKAIALWRETRGHISNICRVIGISRQTFYDWMNTDQEFALALVEAEGELNDDVRDALVQKIAGGDMQAITFYLKSRHPDFKPQPNIMIQQNFGKHVENELKEFE